MELPRPFCHINFAVIHEARLFVMRDTDRVDEQRNTHVFDFGRRGSAVLPLLDENGNREKGPAQAQTELYVQTGRSELKTHGLYNR